MAYKYFVGIDISKLTLDVALLSNGTVIDLFQIANSEKGVKDMLQLIQKDNKCSRRNTLFCAEQMGIYGKFLEMGLTKSRYRLCLEPPLQIKFSMGIQRGKSDALDAQRIATYAWQNHLQLKIWQPPRPVLEQLRALTTLRKRLVKAKVLITNYGKLESYYLEKEHCIANAAFYQATKCSIESDIENIERTIDNVIRGDEKLLNLVTIITSIPFIGKVIAIQLILFTNEFNDISNPRKFASYCGIAPFSYSSGTSLKSRAKVSNIANKEMKSLIHIAALGYTRNNSTFLARYYLRKVEEGKNKMSILNAIRNKLIHRVYACIRENKIYKE